MVDEADDVGPTLEAGPKRGWLEICREPGTAEAVAFCPYRSRVLRVGECFACKDCTGLAMDGPGKHAYVVCARAETDGIATSTWLTQEPIDEAEAWSVRVMAVLPSDDEDDR